MHIFFLDCALLFQVWVLLFRVCVLFQHEYAFVNVHTYEKMCLVKKKSVHTYEKKCHYVGKKVRNCIIKVRKHKRTPHQ